MGFKVVKYNVKCCQETFVQIHFVSPKYFIKINFTVNFFGGGGGGNFLGLIVPYIFHPFSTKLAIVCGVLQFVIDLYEINNVVA